MKTALVLQARANSGRLPRKIFKRIRGVPALEVQMSRLEGAPVDELWLATTSRPDDDDTELLGCRRGWRVFRGEEENVRSRFERIVVLSRPDLIVRVTGDNPFTHRQAVSLLKEEFLIQPESTTWIGDSRVPIYPAGLVPEIFRSDAFVASSSAPEPRELRSDVHVTTGLRSQSGAVITRHLKELLSLNKNWRFTLDTREDLNFLRAFADCLGPNWQEAPYQDIQDAARKNPRLLELNCMVRVKDWGEG